MAGQRANGEAEKVSSSWQRLWLVVAALWLQGMVVVFVVVQIRHVHTPVTDWVNKMIRLLGI